MNSESLAKITDAVILKSSDIDISDFSTDTRTIKNGDIYLPLKGENFDGENFIEDALNKGAIGYFTTSGKIFDNAKVILKVENTQEAYLKIASNKRLKVNPKVIGVTGSSGKTTTKEMIASVCSQKFRTQKTQLNHNNEVGFCQTIMGMPNDTEVLILEMGMRGLGQIELLSKYAIPDITVISNVGTAHIGILGSKENIAKAKCEIVKYQKPNGTFIAPDDELIKNTVKFNGTKIFADKFKILEQKIGYTKFEYKNKLWELNLEGEYNVCDAILAIEVGLSLNMDYKDIFEGLKNYQPIEKRWEVLNKNGYIIIKDCYNANPESMKSALKTIFELYPNSVIVLGDMGELGDKSIFYHREIGNFIKSKNYKYKKLITVGNLAKEISEINNNSINFNDNIETADYILKNIEKNSTVFLKASRSMKFEQIAEIIGQQK